MMLMHMLTRTCFECFDIARQCRYAYGTVIHVRIVVPSLTYVPCM